MIKSVSMVSLELNLLHWTNLPPERNIYMFEQILDAYICGEEEGNSNGDNGNKLNSDKIIEFC